MGYLKSIWQNLVSKERHLLLAVLSLVALSYLRILWGFFQQDEWLSFAYRFLAQTGGVIGIFQDSFAPSVGHYQPLNSLVINILFSVFKLSYVPYAIFSLLLHLTNVYLVFRLAKNFFKDVKAAAIVSLIFGVSAATFQATSWVLADIGVHFSTLFAIFSVSALLNFSKTSSKTAFRRIIIFLIISLLFKEISVGFFAFIPLVILFSKEISNKKEYIFKALVIAGIYVAIRVAMIFLPVSFAKDTLVTKTQSLNNIAESLVTLPVKGLTQSIIPPRFLVREAYLAARLIPPEVAETVGTPAYDLFVQKEILAPITYLNFLVILAIAYLAFKRERESVWSKAVLLGATFVFINSPIFALAPERAGRIFIIDSRNLYLISVGSSFVVFAILNSILKGRKLLLTFSVLLIVLLNVFVLGQELREVTANGILRKNILGEIYSEHPQLPDKAVFYTESDTSLYGLPDEERILPFQSGFGQSLLVWYFPKEEFSTDFLKDRFLWEIADQGYKESRGRGFGYFRDFNGLGEIISKFRFEENSVIAYRYDSEQNIIVDITNEIRGRLRGFKAEKSPIPANFFSLQASDNNDEIGKAVDFERTTSWSSEVPYKNPQHVIISLGAPRKIAQILIDAYTNKDQNSVGFEISISQDGKGWQRVFYAKRYPPGKDGIVSLYIEPKEAKMIKIRQVGYHDFAPWVIHEIKLYEAN